jgi:hypothetical protein
VFIVTPISESPSASVIVLAGIPAAIIKAPPHRVYPAAYSFAADA